jgi:sugar phosphate isomerase/epimerase
VSTALRWDWRGRPIKLGVFDPVFGSLPLDEMLDQVVALGIEAVELGSGGYPGDARCRPAELLADRAARETFRGAFRERGLVISALSCHGNPLHPDPAVARAADAVYRDTVRLAAELEVERLNLFSGCPGDGAGSRTPNWIVAAWPPEYAATLSWQWHEVVLPYWHQAAEHARRHGVRLGIEMHPGFVVYNPRTLLRLRSEVGGTIGANFDPSHLFWQGVDPLGAIEQLAGAIVHVHAKDTWVDPQAVARDGVLDLALTDEGAVRSFAFRSVGDGHGPDFWRRLVVALADAGYDHVLSIEHEDRTLSTEDGLRRAAAVLRQAMADISGGPVAGKGG